MIYSGETYSFPAGGVEKKDCATEQGGNNQLFEFSLSDFHLNQ